MTSSAESEDDDDPQTPMSVWSQGSQGFDPFFDSESFTAIPDTSLQELHIQLNTGSSQEPILRPSLQHYNVVTTALNP
jgi:hypothetical protein